MSEPIYNINTVALDVLKDFDELIAASRKVSLPLESDFVLGFEKGVRAVQDRFLREMDAGKLNYTKGRA